MSQDEHAARDLSRQQGLFARLARTLTDWAGSWWAIVAVLAATVVWVVVGQATGWPRAWEVLVTAGVPVLTLMLLIIVQHTQNHHDRAIQLKLDELLRGNERASNAMIRVEEGSWDELEELQEHFKGHADDH